MWKDDHADVVVFFRLRKVERKYKSQGFPLSLSSFPRIIIEKGLKSMSKRVVWVWSFNNHQQTVSLPNGMSTLLWPNKFQKEMRELLAPEWAIEFISDDLSEPLPKAEVVVIPRTSKDFYTERAKNANVVWITGNELATHDLEEIKKKIIEA
jgi:hypothetical protein